MAALLGHRVGIDAFARSGAGVADPLLVWKSALAGIGTAPAKYMLLGDSLTEGQGATTRANRWQDLMHAAILRDYSLSGGAGYVQAAFGVYAPDSTWADWRTAVSGTTTADLATGSAATFGLHRIRISNGGSSTWTFTGTDADIWYQQGTGAGSFTYQIDGGTAVTVTVPTTGTLTAVRLSIASQAAGSHTIKVNGTTANPAMIAGFMFYNGDKTSGIHKYESGSTSAAGYHYTNLNPQFTTAVQTAAPDLVVLGLGGNDAGYVSAASFQGTMSALISGLKAMTKSPSIILVKEYFIASQTYPNDPWASYMAAIDALATQYNCAVLDLTGSGFPSTTTSGTGLYSTDGIHPNNSGQARMASVYGKALGFMVPIVAPSISGATAVGSVLTVDPGTWYSAPQIYAYQWLRGGATISGATNSTYTTVSADNATSVTCRVTTIRTDGTIAGINVTNAIAVGAASSIFTENFPGASGAAWPTGWTALVGTSGSVQQAGSGVGRLTSAADPYNFTSMAYRTTDTSADWNLLFDVAFSSVTLEQYPSIFIRTSTPTSAGGSLTGYALNFYPHNGVNSGSVSRMNNGADNSMSGDLALGQFVANTYKRVRFQILGTTLRVRVWDPAGAEPGTWAYSTTDSSITGTGRVIVANAIGGTAGSVQTLLKNMVATAA